MKRAVGIDFLATEILPELGTYSKNLFNSQFPHCVLVKHCNCHNEMAEEQWN